MPALPRHLPLYNVNLPTSTEPNSPEPTSPSGETSWPKQTVPREIECLAETNGAQGHNQVPKANRQHNPERHPKLMEDPNKSKPRSQARVQDPLLSRNDSARNTS